MLAQFILALAAVAILVSIAFAIRMLVGTTAIHDILMVTSLAFVIAFVKRQHSYHDGLGFAVAAGAAVFLGIILGAALVRWTRKRKRP